jgi:hypothetical protein
VGSWVGKIYINLRLAISYIGYPAYIFYPLDQTTKMEIRERGEWHHRKLAAVLQGTDRAEQQPGSSQNKEHAA